MQLYFVKSISPTDPPDGGAPGLWWKYTIECGIVNNDSISGVREGSREEIESYIKKMLDSINSRTMGHQSAQMRAAHRSPKSLPANLPSIRSRM